MRAPVYCVCLMTKVADGCKFRIRGWTGVACEGPRVSQSCKAGMLQDKCRDLGCFGGERAKFTVAVHAQLLAGRAFFSHPFGLPPGRHCGSPHCHTTQQMCLGFFFLPTAKTWRRKQTLSHLHFEITESPSLMETFNSRIVQLHHLG